MGKFIVIIVTCNRIQLLKECVECVLKQKTMPEKIIIINNNSTDGSKEYLEEEFSSNSLFIIANEKKNIGGAGGFSKGVELALKEQGDWLLLIDDDAMLSSDYLYQTAKAIDKKPQYKAFSGVVKVKNRIDITHRRRKMKKKRLSFQDIPEKEYRKEYFCLDAASFCGLVISKEIVQKIGLPEEAYFIWNDDLEYSLRIRKYTKILNVNQAILNHKTNLYSQRKSKKYLWKDYYGFRNFYYTCRKHGYKIDCIYSYLKERMRLIYWRFRKRISAEDYQYNIQMIQLSWKHAKDKQLGICHKYFPGS